MATDARPCSAWQLPWALFRMSRPLQLLLLVVIYATGVVMAFAHGASADPATLWAGFASMLLVSASIHYVNEYADYETDARTDPTPFSGGSGALVVTDLSRGLALRAAAVTLGAALAVAAMALLRDWLATPAAAVLLGSAVLGWMYSVPPLALAWRGLGELDNAVLAGVALPVYGYAATAGLVIVEAVLAFVPLGALGFCNLLATTWPDREADAEVGKHTLATRWPARRLRAAYYVGVAVFVVSLLALWGRALPTPVVTGGLLVVPLSAWGAMTYTRQESPMPTVTATTTLAVLQFLAWSYLAFGA